MTIDKPDPTSDEARTDPKTADATRRELSEKAEQGLRQASTSSGAPENVTEDADKTLSEDDGHVRFKQTVDTSKTPEEERLESRRHNDRAGHSGATTK